MANEFLKSPSVNSLKKLNNFAVISTFISETALLLWSDLTKFVCHATGSGQVTGQVLVMGLQKWEKNRKIRTSEIT